MFGASKTASVSGGYQISRSLRFNSADSAYLNRTPASAGNRTTWTWSGWIKRSVIGTGQSFFVGNSSFTDANYTEISFLSDNNLYVYGATTNWRQTTQVFRDVSAWYHIVIVWDTTQATAANRIKLYVNGAEVTSFVVSNNPAQNATSGINAASVHYISSYNSSAQFYNGYMTEVNFIDGQALTPSSFGETNAQTGVWQPKAYSGSYGTNGFYLNFSDNSNTTAATLGKDYSGNGNNWTPNNFSVTAGAGNDSLVDSPTSYGTDTGVGGTVRGNYSTMNPVNKGTVTLTNGNLDADAVDATGIAYNTIGMSSGKWYWEVTAGSGSQMIGIGKEGGLYDFRVANGYGYFYFNGQKYNSNTGASYGATYTSGDIIGVALDMDAGTLTFYKNGTSQGTAYTGLSGTYFANTQNGAGGSAIYIFNFGQRAFAYTAPSGFKALCTQNLPTPTIGATTATQAGKYFNPVLYTGNGGTQSITGVGFQPDFTWVKSRTTTNGNGFEDAVRGAGITLESNNTAAEVNYSAYFTAFTSDGFNMALGGGFFNSNGQNYVAWNWRASNTTAVTNTSGSVTSTVSANTTSGFSVLTYSGGNLTSATIGHGLGVAPSMVIVKRRNAVDDWRTYHVSVGATKYMDLNTTNAAATATVVWNDTAPTSTVFTVGNSASVNASGGTYVAYCFAPISGYSAFGSYTGNGSTDGPFVFTGFRPAFVLTKRTDSTGDWQLMDSSRDTYNVANKALFPNTTDLETTGYSKDFLSNGFKIRDSGASLNASGGSYIYMAFASNPFKYSLAR